MSFNRRLTVNVGDIVFFVKPQFSLAPINDDIAAFSMSQIYQGKVTHITGTKDMDICVNVIDINGETYGACQEVFSTDLQTILDIIELSGGSVDEPNWVEGLKAKCGDVIKYPYEIIFPYEKGHRIEQINTEWGPMDNVTLERCLFTLGTIGAWRGNVKVQYQLSPINKMIYSVEYYQIDAESKPYTVVKV